MCIQAVKDYMATGGTDAVYEVLGTKKMKKPNTGIGPAPMKAGGCIIL